MCCALSGAGCAVWKCRFVMHRGTQGAVGKVDLCEMSNEHRRKINSYTHCCTPDYTPYVAQMQYTTNVLESKEGSLILESTPMLQAFGT